MLDPMLKLLGNPGQVEHKTIVVQLRQPGSEQSVTEPDNEDAEEGDHGDASEDEECPLCGGEHEPLNLSPDLEILLAHLASELAGGQSGVDVADEEADDGDGEEVDHDDSGLHLMPKK